MAARFSRLLVALGLLFGTALPSAAAAVVRPPTSQDITASPVPGRAADPAYARSYFGARYYRADLGRFTTVDPAYTLKENLEDPQRWNRYAYARNNPLRYTDPDGQAIVCGSPACQEYARRMAELKREYESASGFAKGWAFVKYALAAGEILSIGTMALTVPRAGVEGVSVVLGEGMSRVEAVAKELGAGIFEGGTGAHVPLDARNLGWLQAQIDKGATIYDIGLDAARVGGRSPFYSAEVALLKKSGYIWKFVKFMMANGEVYEVGQWVPKG